MQGFISADSCRFDINS